MREGGRALRSARGCRGSGVGMDERGQMQKPSASGKGGRLEPGGLAAASRTAGASRSLTLVIPAFEEERRLPPTLAAASRALPRLARRAEIVVVDDGSRDGTAEVARRFPAEVPIRVLRLRENRGKGFAVARGVAAARSEWIAFTDADCPYDLDSLEPMLRALEEGRADVAIGARDLPASAVNRGYGWLRYASGRAFSFLTWLALGLPFRDSQCGLKAFRAEVARELFALRTVDGFGFDFEVLAAAVGNGFRVERFPVRLTHDDDSRIDLVADSARMAADLWRVRRALRAGSYRLAAGSGEARPCPLCGDESRRPRAARDGFRMVECRRCGLWYLHPMPTRGALERLYAASYFRSGDPGRRGYADYAAQGDDCRATFRRRLSVLDGHVGEGRLLDVGAGFGYLADVAAARFSERWVVEMSEAAARRIHPSHRLVLGSFETAELPERYFDVVSLQDCLEHLPDPLPALGKIRRLLRPGGALLAVTPDVRSWLARLQGRRWISLKFPEHVVLYSEATLRRALGEAGFRVERVEPAGQYARLDLLATRLASARPRLGRMLAALAGRRRLYLPSGSLAVLATADG